MQQIADSGELDAAPFLLAYTLNAAESEAKRASDAVAALVAPLDDADLVVADQHFRSHTWYLPNIPGRDAWLQMQPGHLANLGQQVPDAAALFGVASFHFSGYIRERAVMLLGHCHGGEELPYLLLRLNDWVDIVATRATDEVRKRLVPQMAGAFAKNIALVQRLMALRRIDHSAIFAAIVELLAKPESQPQLQAALAGADAGTRKIIYLISAKSTDVIARQAVTQALSDPAPVIRLWAIRTARSVLSASDLAQAIDVAMADRFSAVRLAATYALVDSAPEKLSTVLPTLLMSASASLRAIARFHLGKIGDIDFNAFYIDQLGSMNNRKIEIAIAALGEIGDIANKSLLASYLHDSRPRICAAAVRSLARLCGDEFISEFTAILLGREGMPAKQAMLALMPRASLVDKELVWARFRQHGGFHTRSRMLRLLANTGKWEAFRFVMMSRRDDEAHIAALADVLLGKWMHEFNRSSVRPSDEELALAIEAVEKFSTGIDQQRLRQLHFSLK